MTDETRAPSVDDDVRTLAKLAVYAAVLLCAAAVLGLSVRVFILMSGLGG